MPRPRPPFPGCFRDVLERRPGFAGTFRGRENCTPGIAVAFREGKKCALPFSDNLSARPEPAPECPARISGRKKMATGPAGSISRHAETVIERPGSDSGRAESGPERPAPFSRRGETPWQRCRHHLWQTRRLMKSAVNCAWRLGVRREATAPRRLRRGFRSGTRRAFAQASWLMRASRRRCRACACHRTPRRRHPSLRLLISETWYDPHVLSRSGSKRSVRQALALHSLRRDTRDSALPWAIRRQFRGHRLLHAPDPVVICACCIRRTNSAAKSLAVCLGSRRGRPARKRSESS